MNRTGPLELLAIDHLLTEEERDIQATVREFVAQRVKPNIADWYERGDLDIGLMRETGELGLLGMHLEGYGCAGANAVSYGLACLELEAGDSGVRSMVSVQGSLAMFAIWKFGSEEHKTTWLPRMATGEAIGCFGLTEADFGSNPAGMRTRAKRDGDDWVINGTKMWITNGSVADVAIVWAQTDDGIRGFIVPTDTPGFSAPKITKKLSLRASITSELILEDVHLPPDSMLPDAAGLRGPLSCLNEARFGIVFGALGAARDCLACTWRAMAAPEQTRCPTGWRAWSLRLATPAYAAWCRYRAPLRCSRSGSSAARNKKPPGCLGWPRVRRSAASG
jgi:glutaryl-CoA dehydrogenase